MKQIGISLFTIGILMIAICSFGQDYRAIKNLPNEKWWGGKVVDGTKMPMGAVAYQVNQFGNTDGNQAQPLLLSNMGRYIWCDEPMEYSFENDSVLVQSKFARIEIGKAGNTLKEAFLAVSQKHFPASGKIPDKLFFTNPVYNTWIELTYNQNQQDILRYAHAIIDNGFPPGVLMIDDTWQTNYGVWEFNPARFGDAKKMMEELHRLGFKVMLWTCPFVSADSENFRKLRKRGALLLDGGKKGEPAIVQWWNGYSAVLDFTKKEAVDWFKGQLDSLQDIYGVDGFKFDAGDPTFYKEGKNTEFAPTPNTQNELYARIGAAYPFNEFRSCWKMGGQPLMQRLCDKGFEWAEVNRLIPDMLLQGILGYSYGCPDMIGGGEYNSFLGTRKIDEEMYVRSAQIHAVMPVMQFSVAPWRVLDPVHLNAVRSAVALHQKLGKIVLQLAGETAKTGEPIIRLMEYDFPHQGYESIKDQFMLGNDYLIAPVAASGITKRQVFLPKGKWEDATGKVWEGGKIVSVDVKLEEVPLFRKISK